MATGTIDAIAKRVSVRRYDGSQEVSDEMVERLLRAAMAAPSAMNLRPWQFVVVRDRETLAALAATNPYAGMVAQAPVAFVVCGDTVNEARGEPNRWWMLDCSAATENLLLQATAEGLGSLWTAVYPHEERIEAVRRILGIPERHVPLCIVPVGRSIDPSAAPKDKWTPSKIHNGRW